MRPRLSVLSAPRHWQLWAQPRSFVAAVLLLALVCVAATAAALRTESFDRSSLTTVGLILVLNSAFDVVTMRVDSLRRRLSLGPLADMTSVWTFAAAVVLAPGQAGLLIALLGLVQWFSRPRGDRGRPYRRVVTWSAIMIAALCASAAIAFLTPRLAALPTGAVLTVTTLVALVVYFVVDGVLLFGAHYLAIRPAPIRSVLGTAEETGLEIATLCLGGLAGLCLVYEPWLILLVLPPMVLLQRSALVKQLEQAATTDAKTGLLNAAAWEQIARRELARAEREQTRLAVIILDLDFFKSVNDLHGHLTGDAALVDVARCLTRELRPYDVVGRFGGEEFVALLPDTDLRGAQRAAERIRSRIATLAILPVGQPREADRAPDQTLSASVGVAVYPAHGDDLPSLLHRADAALYHAKRAGRNRVSVAGSSHGSTPDVVATPAS